MNRGVVTLRRVPLLAVLVVGAACGIALAVGELAWGFFASGAALSVLALPRDEPREHQAEADPYGLKEAAATFALLALALTLIAVGVFLQI